MRVLVAERAFSMVSSAVFAALLRISGQLVPVRKQIWGGRGTHSTCRDPVGLEVDILSAALPCRFQRVRPRELNWNQASPFWDGRSNWSSYGIAPTRVAQGPRIP